MYRMYNLNNEKDIALDLIKDNDLLAFFKENYDLENPDDIYSFLQNEENFRTIMDYIENGNRSN